MKGLTSLSLVRVLYYSHLSWSDFLFEATKCDEVNIPELIEELQLKGEAEVVENSGRIKSCEEAQEALTTRKVQLQKQKTRGQNFNFLSETDLGDKKSSENAATNFYKIRKMS